MQVIALCQGDSALAISRKYSLRYIGSEAGSIKLELTFEYRGAFAVTAKGRVYASTARANEPEEFTMQRGDSLTIDGELITVRQLSGGKLAVNYFGCGQFAYAPCLVGCAGS